MTQRNINQLTRAGRYRALEQAAARLDAALNLFGVDAEPISDLLSSDDESTMRRVLAEIMTPECRCGRGCDHAFPPHFVRAAQPYATAFARLWCQIDRAR